MISVPEGRERAIFESQLISLLQDLMKVDGGVVLVADSEAALVRAAEARVIAEGAPSELCAALFVLAPRVTAEGSCFDASTGCLAVPMFASGQLQGAIFVRCTPTGIAALEDQRDALAALATLVASAVQSQREIQGLRVRTELLEESLGHDRGIVGESAIIRKLLAMVNRVAPLDVTVLIQGESGTGKELVARAIHRGSAREKKPFIAINCAALTDSLLESELFGHEKGSFTGAIAQKKGRLELAQGGTVFLDEIGELAPLLQAKLLRVLQEREFERVGGTQTIPLDVRLIAASNRDLSAEVQRGAFREDLYHRLNVVVIRSPALRERAEDIPLLADYFVRSAAARCHRRVSGISSKAKRALMAYPWPGNVRELANAMERAVVLGESDEIQVEDLPETVFEVPKPPGGVAPILASVGDAKRDSIVRAWTEARGDYKIAAQRLGVHPNSLLRLIRNLGLRDILPRFSEGG
jgi:Nif-specific regulatory protein